MAGTWSPDYWIRTDELIKLLQNLPEDSYVMTNQLGNLAIFRPHPLRPTLDGFLGWIDVKEEEYQHAPFTSDEEWPEVSASPIFVGDKEWK